MDSAQSLIGSIIIRVAYGLDARGSDVKYIDIAEEAMDTFNITFQPGRYLVQTFPSLAFVPAWFPGAQWKRDFVRRFASARRIVEVPWAAAMHDRVRICVRTICLVRTEPGNE